MCWLFCVCHLSIQTLELVHRYLLNNFLGFWLGYIEPIDQAGNSWHLTILSLPIHEHGISLHLFSFPLISFIRVLLDLYLGSFFWGFPGSSGGKEPTCNAGDPGLIPGLGRSPREGIGYPVFMGYPGGSDGKKICLQCGRLGFDSWVGKIPRRRAWQPTPVFPHGESPQTEEPGGHDYMTKDNTGGC